MLKVFGMIYKKLTLFHQFWVYLVLNKQKLFLNLIMKVCRFLAVRLYNSNGFKISNGSFEKGFLVSSRPLALQ